MTLRKFSLKRVIGIVLVFFALSIICVSLFYNPIEKLYLVPSTKNIVESFSWQDVKTHNSCYVKKDGVILVDGDDPYITFDCIKAQREKIKSIYIKLADETDSSIQPQLFVDTGYGFSEKKSFSTTCEKGYDYWYFELPQSNLSSIRLDVDEDYQFTEVFLCSENAERIIIPEEKSGIKRGLLCALLLVIIIAFLDCFIDITENLLNRILWCRKTLLAIALAILGCILIWLFSPINPFAMTYLYGIILTVLLMILEYRNLEEKPERFFAGIIGIVGMVFLLCQPFGHISWDAETHYKWALSQSGVGNVRITQADKDVIENDIDFVKVPKNNYLNSVKIKKINDLGNYTVSEITTVFSLPHLLNGILIAILRLFHVDFYWRYVLGKLPNLLIYLLASYWAMKKLKSGKMILATVALFPTNLYLATNYSYDYWVVCFSFLGIAYFVAGCQGKKRGVTWKDAFIMEGALALAVLPKKIYILLLLFPLLIPWKKLKNKKWHYIICLLILGVLFVLFLLNSASSSSGTGDIRGGSDVAPMQQIMYVLGNPFEYALRLLSFMKVYLSIGKMSRYISHFAYLGVGGGAFIFIGLIMFTTLTDKNDRDKGAYLVITRIFAVLMFIGSVVLVATAMYVIYNPVANRTIDGCQPRYLIPLIYPLLAVITGKGIRLPHIPKQLYNMVVLSLCTVVLYYDVFQMFLHRLI